MLKVSVGDFENVNYAMLLLYNVNYAMLLLCNVAIGEFGKVNVSWTDG